MISALRVKVKGENMTTLTAAQSLKQLLGSKEE
jgi:hypothetical protein